MKVGRVAGTVVSTVYSGAPLPPHPMRPMTRASDACTATPRPDSRPPFNRVYREVREAGFSGDARGRRAEKRG